MKQTEFRFYDKFPEQLRLDVTQEQPQPDYSNSIISINGGGLHFACNNISAFNNISLNNIVLEEGEKPSFIKRVLLKQLGIKTR